MTKILHIIKSLGRGGAEMLLPETLKLHDHTKFEFHYIYFLPWKNQMVEAIQQAGGKVTCLRASNNFKIMLQWKNISRYIVENKIDIVHCHLPWAGFVGRLVHQLSGVPLLYTEHNKQERYHSITRVINRLTFSWQTKVIAVSQDVSESILKNIGNKVPITVIKNGVNTVYFRRDGVVNDPLKTKLGIPVGGIVVGIVSVFRFQKRLKEWVDVFALALNKCPGLFGVIVGDGPLKVEVSNHIKSKNLEGRILLPGLQTEVKLWYSVMDVFMMTSVFEGLPIALLEAMSMECAILTTNAGGIKEVVRENTDGIVVDVDSWMKLSDHLVQLASNETRRKQLAASARHRVQQAFGMKKMVDELESLYSTL